jgi:hypothetical protein
MTDHPGSAVLPKSAASSRTRTIIYWVVTLPVLAETAAGIQWDLARSFASAVPPRPRSPPGRLGSSCRTQVGRRHKPEPPWTPSAPAT